MTPTNIGLVVKECVCVCFMNLVGIVFGPNVMKPLDKKMLTDVGYTHKCNAIMTAILQLESFGEMPDSESSSNICELEDLAVLEPTSSTIWEVGQTYSITWTPHVSSPQVSLYLYVQEDQEQQTYVE